LLGRDHRAETDRAITDDRDRVARLHVGIVGAEPAGAQYIGSGQQAGDQIVGRDVRSGDQGAVGERDTQEGRLRALRSYGLVVHAPALITRLTDGADVVRSEKRADDELAGLDIPDRASD